MICNLIFVAVPGDLYFTIFHEPYFRRKHIFRESYRVNRMQDYGLKAYR